MSLHQKTTMSKSRRDSIRRTTMAPQFSPGGRLSVSVGDRSVVGGGSRQRRVGEGQIGVTSDSVKPFFAILFQKSHNRQKTKGFFWEFSQACVTQSGAPPVALSGITSKNPNPAPIPVPESVGIATPVGNHPSDLRESHLYYATHCWRGACLTAAGPQ